MKFDPSAIRDAAQAQALAKICTRCKKNVPATLEYFFAHKSNADRLQSCCKKCNAKAQSDYKIRRASAGYVPRGTPPTADVIEARRLRKLERNRKWRLENPEKRDSHQRTQHLKRYNLSPEAFASMHQEQMGACAICGVGLEHRGRGQGRSVIDHCHATGKVRALLCSFCNTGMGLFRENPATLRAAAAYLERHAGGAK